MPPNGPHPFAFFCLVPGNLRAQVVLSHPENAHLVSEFQDQKSREIIRGLDVGLYIGSKSRYTLATIGRCGDILVEGTGISRIQCSFEIHEDNPKEVMLQDRSTNKSTQLFGKTAIPFEPGRTHRRVVVDKTVNLEFGFGGVACDLYRFRIHWHEHANLMSNIDYREDNPRQTRTVLDEPPTTSPSFPITRVHTPANTVKIRYSKREKLGSGAFGEVWKVANVDSGEYLAVKQVRRPAPQSYEYLLLKREVETLSRISHRHIIEYRDAQWRDEHFVIIMELKPGNVEGLIQKGLFIDQPESAKQLLHHMLQALDYLASQSIIHRDVKPENILYTPIPEDGGHLFQLADFGLANIVADAQSLVGSRRYMAPELECSPQSLQTPKIDVWSLFVTIAYAMNIAGFRGKPQQTTPLRIKAIREAAIVYAELQGMAVVDPTQRATAADILDKIFSGQGRTTRNNQMYSATMRSEAPEPGPSEQRVQQETVATAISHRGKRVRTEKQRSPQAVTAERGKRQGSDRESEKQLPSRNTVQRRRRRDAPQLPGAFPDA